MRRGRYSSAPWRSGKRRDGKVRRRAPRRVREGSKNGTEANRRTRTPGALKRRTRASRTSTLLGARVLQNLVQIASTSHHTDHFVPRCLWGGGGERERERETCGQGRWRGTTASSLHWSSAADLERVHFKELCLRVCQQAALRRTRRANVQMLKPGERKMRGGGRETRHQ